MDNGKDRPDDRDELTISGIYDIRMVQPVEPQREGRMEVDEYVNKMRRIQEVYNRRAEIRNSFRSWVEKSPRLSRLFGLSAIPQMTPQDILDEERVWHERVLRRLAKEERDVHPVRTLAHASRFANIHVDEQTMQREERAKYGASQMKRFIDVHRYRDAREVHEKSLKRAANKDENESVMAADGFIAVDGVRKCLMESDAEHIVAAVLELGAVGNICPTDFDDLPVEVLRNPKIIEAVTKKLGEFLERHPKFYEQVRDYFVKTGLLEQETADRSPAVLASAKKVLDGAMFEHPVVFARFRDMLDEMGIMTIGEANALPSIQAKAMGLLEHNMACSPDLYLAVRDKLATLGIVNPKECDQDPEIQKRFLGHLLCWKDLKLVMFGKFRFHWAKKGLIEPDIKKLDIGAIGAKQLVYDMGGSFRDESFYVVPREEQGDHACAVFQRELARVDQILNSAPNIEYQAIERVVSNAVDYYSQFMEEYPQVGDPRRALQELQLK